MAAWKGDPGAGGGGGRCRGRPVRSAGRARPPGQCHRAERGRAVDRVRHPRLPGTERAGAAGGRRRQRPADDLPGVHQGGRQPAALLGAVAPRLAARHRRGAERRARRRRRPGAGGPAQRDHHPERGRAAPGGGRAGGDRAARVAAPGRVLVVLAALAPGGAGPAAAGGQPALDRGRGGARAGRQPGRGRGAGGDRRVHRGGLSRLRRRAQAGRGLLWRERAQDPGRHVLRAGVRRGRAGRPRVVADGDVGAAVRSARRVARDPRAHREPGGDPRRRPGHRPARRAAWPHPDRAHPRPGAGRRARAGPGNTGPVTRKALLSPAGTRAGRRRSATGPPPRDSARMAASGPRRCPRTRARSR